MTGTHQVKILSQPEEIQAGILAEIDDLKKTAQAFGWEQIKNGSWFNQFLNACLKGYHERVIQQGGEAYLRSKYPGLPTEAVAGKLCEMAEQTAAIAEACLVQPPAEQSSPQAPAYRSR